MSNVYTLATLNTLRAKNNLKPLKAWKESKAKLEAACAKLAKVASVTDLPPNKELKVEASAGKKDAKKVVKKDAKPAKEKNVDGVSISTIAAELDIDPKVARAKLRRQDEVPCIEGSQWLFDKKDVPAIKAILKGDARKKAA